MTDIIAKINDLFLQELTPAKNNTYVCPICGSGSGRKGTGITTKDYGQHYTCWAGDCFVNASPIDILAKQAGIDPSDTKRAIENACQHFGIDNKEFFSTGPLDKIKQAEAKREKMDQELTAYFDKWSKAIKGTEAEAYIKGRGISQATIERFNLGYMEHRGAKYVVIPTGPNSYNARNIAPDAYPRYYKPKGQPSGMLNIKALETAQEPVFITEGEINALSFIEMGFEAIGLGGLANLNKAIARAKELNFQYPLIVALDNDERGKEAQDKLQLSEDVFLYKAPADVLYRGQKDANDALIENRPAFDEVAQAIYNEAITAQRAKTDEKHQEAIEQIERDSVASARDLFEETIERNRTAPFIPTGFTDFDRILDGGLFPGLYVVGAISSLGKTTFCLQVADQIAESGQDVLIFSLEMSKVELMAKSISRLTAYYDMKYTKTLNHAKTTRGILTGSRYQEYSSEDMSLIDLAKDHYFGSIAPHLFIYEGVGTIGARQVREKVKTFKEITGKAPVVVIDYLQILAPDDKYLTDKQAVDQNVMELKRISRDYEIPVIGVSSFNRENYSVSVNMTAFKESGAIEYSSDVLIGLQYKEMKNITGDPKTNSNKEKVAEIFNQINEKATSKEPIAIQVKVLKNRNGRKGDVDLAFIPMFNRFENAGSYFS
jgi:replicative DNA helicase